MRCVSWVTLKMGSREWGGSFGWLVSVTEWVRSLLSLLLQELRALRMLMAIPEKTKNPAVLATAASLEWPSPLPAPCSPASLLNAWPIWVQLRVLRFSQKFWRQPSANRRPTRNIANLLGNSEYVSDAEFEIRFVNSENFNIDFFTFLYGIKRVNFLIS